ncbi:MAG: hypothetical protein PHY08_07950 [Candidatus Cloacimonetes bacterium]|nr:hypothetical protein [Candidatus Cloacimonadota bacterium]
MKNKKCSIMFIIFGIALPIIVIAIYSALSIQSKWNSWGLQDDGTLVMPDFWNYMLLIFFKLSLYIFPAMIISIGQTITNKKNIKKSKYLYYTLDILSLWFLVLLTIKLFSDSILELDRIFDFTLFNSIKDVQTLIGLVVTVILKRQFELKAGFIDQSKLSDIVQTAKQ